MLILCFMLAFTESATPGYPYTDVMAHAQSILKRLRQFHSDYPPLARFSWSAIPSGPCPNELNTLGRKDLPCSAMPFVPNPIHPQLPSVLYTQYQKISYTAPADPSHPKAALTFSWKYTLISAGIIWEMTVTAAGIQHDLYLCHYRKQRLWLPFLEIYILRPGRAGPAVITISPCIQRARTICKPTISSNGNPCFPCSV